MGILCQRCETHQVQGKVHIALGFQTSPDLCFQGQKFRLRRVGKKAGVIGLQTVIQKFQILLTGLRPGWFRRQHSGAESEEHRET